MYKEWTSNHVDCTKSLTAEEKELNMSKTKFEYQLLEISSLYAMANPLLWSQKISADEKDSFNLILILVQVELPKNESNAYQESTFSVTAHILSNNTIKMC